MIGMGVKDHTAGVEHARLLVAGCGWTLTLPVVPSPPSFA
jgi:hypothetical protein